MGEPVGQGKHDAEPFTLWRSNETLRDQCYRGGQAQSLSVTTGTNRYSQDRQASSVAESAMNLGVARTTSHRVIHCISTEERDGKRHEAFHDQHVP